MIEYAPTLATRRSERAERAVALARGIDWLLVGAIGGLLAYGLWAIGGITRHDVPGDSDYYVVRQAFFAGVGVVGLTVGVAVDPRVYRRFMRPIYGGLVGLLLAVFLVGEQVRGAKRWIDLGFFQFQPSEFGKVLLILALAAFAADRAKRIGDWRTPAALIGLAAVPILLVYREPDLGTALVYTAGLAAVLFVSGTRWLHLGVLVVVGAVAAAGLLWLLPKAGIQVLEKYQADRIAVFGNPSRDPTGAGYNVDQSVTAVGAGGVHGRGIDDATQTKLEFLPEHATDFVFAALAEQRGFVGAATLFLLYLLLLWRGLRVVSIAGDLFSAVAAGGIVFALLFQIFVNVGMTMEIAPVTGIPLPFVSVGGSAMVANLVAMGILLGIGARGRRR